MISGHTHEPELSVVGNGFYANTGSGTASVVARPARLRLPHPFVTVHRFSYVEMTGGAVLGLQLWLREVPGRVPGPARAAGPGPAKVDMTTTTQGGGATQRTDLAARRVGAQAVGDSAAGPPVGRRRAAGRRRAERHLRRPLADPGTRSVDHWLPFGVHPLSVAEALVAGLALCGLARGVRRGLRRRGWPRIVLLVATTTDRLIQGRPPGDPRWPCCSACGCSSSTSTSGSGRPGVTRLFIWAAAVGLVVIGATAGVGNLVGTGRHDHFDVVFLAGGAWSSWPLLLVALPGRESRRTGTAREEAFDRARAIIEPTAATPSTTSPSGTTSRGSSPASPWWPTRSSTA